MPHPRGVALREVVVHRHKLHVLAREGVQIERECRDQRLALARLHLGDLPLVQHDAADELHVERNHVPRQRVSADLFSRADEMTAGVLHERIRLGQNRVKGLALLDALTERFRHLRIVLVGKALRLIFFFDSVDFTNDRPQLLQFAVVFRS